MRVSLLSALGSTLLLATANARSLSYYFKSSEQKACFYAMVDPKVHLPSAILQFYYAASDAKGADVVQVDAIVTSPSGQQVHAQSKQTHSEVNIKPTMAGEYALCLTHHGAPTNKFLDVDVTLPTMPHSASQTDESTKLEGTITKLQRELADLVHTIRYIKNRERRNLETVESIENWVFYISTFEVLLIAGMSVLQLTVLRMFFSGSGKQRV